MCKRCVINLPKVEDASNLIKPIRFDYVCFMTVDAAVIQRTMCLEAIVFIARVQLCLHFRPEFMASPISVWKVKD